MRITRGNARHLVRGGRTRWKIENETFNTLKNQGYQFEHNFGHGSENLSVVFAMLMMLQRFPAWCGCAARWAEGGRSRGLNMISGEGRGGLEKLEA